MSFKHLILYDHYCLLCRKAVLYILTKDIDGIFCFASLDGKTAAQYKNLPKDTLILIQDYQTSPKRHIRSQAVFRIFWILGKKERFLGFFFCIPWFADFMYRQVAKKRHALSRKDKVIFPQKFSNRFKN